MPQSLIGLKQIKSGEIGNYVTGFLGVGVTGANSVSIYKDLFVTGKANFSGDVTFNNDVTFVQEAFFYSGAKFSGDITGLADLILSGDSTFSGVATFKTGVFFEKNVNISGNFSVDGASTFNDPSTFFDSALFNSSVQVTGNFSVGIGTSVFSGKTSLLGNNTFGANAGASTNNYFVGTNIFTGNSNFTGDILSIGTNIFNGTNNFNSAVNFKSGDVIFSGTKQDFLTPTNLSGYTKINRTGEAENFIVNQTLNLAQSSVYKISGSGVLYNSNYLSGASANLYIIDGASSSFSASSHSDFQSGSYELFNKDSYLKIKTGAFLDLEGNIYARNTSKTYFQSGSNLYFNSGSVASGILNLVSGSSIGIGTSLPSAAIDVQGYNINVNGTGYFKDLRQNGYEVINEYVFNSKSYQLSAGDYYKTVTYNAVSGSPIISANVRYTGIGTTNSDADWYATMISGSPTTTQATILFSAPISISNKYNLDVIISSPTF